MSHLIYRKIVFFTLFVCCLVSACSNFEGRKPKALPSLVATPLLDAALFFDESTVSRPQLSPNAKTVAFIKTVNDVPNIFIQSLEDGARPYQLTRSSVPIRNFIWSTDNQDILYIKDNNGDENYGLFKISIANSKEGKAEEITLVNLADARVSISDTIENDPDSIMITLNDRDSRFFDLYRLNIRSGKRERVFENNEGFTRFLTDKNGALRIAQRQADVGGQVIYGFDGSSSKSKELIRTVQNELMSVVTLSKNGDDLYFASNSGNTDKTQLRSLNLSTGEQKLIDSDPLDKSDIYQTLFSPAGDLLLTSYYDAYQRVYIKKESFKSTFNAIKQQLEGLQITIIEMSKDENTILLKAGSGNTPTGFYIYRADQKKLTLFYQNSPTLNPKLLAHHSSIEYSARDGEIIQAYLTLPNGKEKKHLPLVVIPHGGPWVRDYAMFDDGFFNRMAQFLANRGYAVLQPNYRSSSGFGKRFFNLGHRTWGRGAMQHDITDGVKHLIDLGIVDKARVGIFGGSYGGYAALAGATFTPDVYSAVISFVGPSSLVTLVESFPDYWRPLLKGTWFSWVGDPQNKEDLLELKRRSPLNYVDSIKAPVLLIQGANDVRVKQAESEQIARAMYEKGLPVEYILAKDEGHGFGKKNNKLAAAIAVEYFLAEHLGGNKKAITDSTIVAHLEKLKQDVSEL
ncbi:S9 family peptidase [Agarilytica rhodophyticola]|uniref:S9 family peptidase n=1 Tax=Agarilytica rhodophyticola TaxID=1737490 RepID=UPI000B349DBA|nr:S9 family peptidase [Agarilytica rhodophyticola]